MFGEDLFGCCGEMLGGSAGGVELQDQCSGLFSEGGFHAGQLAHLLAGESGVQLMNVGIGAQDVGQHDGIGVIGLRSRHGVTLSIA